LRISGSLTGGLDGWRVRVRVRVRVRGERREEMGRGRGPVFFKVSAAVD
jgi:hypothetical protein